MQNIGQNKKYWNTNNIKREKNNESKVDIKNSICKYFNHIIKIEDFDIGNILLDKKSYKNIFIYDVLYITFTSAKSLHIIFNNLDGFTRDSRL